MKTTSEILSGEKGFSLIEVLISMAIFAIGMLAVGSLQISAIQANDRASLQTEGSDWAQNQIEQLIAIDYDPADPAIPLDPDADPDEHKNTDPSGKYTIEWTLSAGPVANSILVDVTVSWNERGANKTQGYAFIKAEYF